MTDDRPKNADVFELLSTVRQMVIEHTKHGSISERQKAIIQLVNGSSLETKHVKDAAVELLYDLISQDMTSFMQYDFDKEAHPSLIEMAFKHVVSPQLIANGKQQLPTGSGTNTMMIGQVGVGSHKDDDQLSVLSDSSYQRYVKSL